MCLGILKLFTIYFIIISFHTLPFRLRSSFTKHQFPHVQKMAAVRMRMMTKHLVGQARKWNSSPAIVQRAMSSAIDGDNGKAVLATRTKRNILDSSISYLDTGKGEDVVIFLHGNPTSSYLWRNIIPHVQPIARCLAPDLIGMGHSGKEPNNSYRFIDHFKYLSAWIEDMALPKKLHFVIHDWGSGLGFHWCNLNRDRVASISYLEALVGPIPSWDKFPEVSRQVFQAMRSPAGECLTNILQVL